MMLTPTFVEAALTVGGPYCWLIFVTDIETVQRSVQCQFAANFTFKKR